MKFLKKHWTIVLLAVLMSDVEVYGARDGTVEESEREFPYQEIDLSLFEDGIMHWQRKHGRDRDDPRYDPRQIVQVADNLLRFQNEDGGWPKDIDWLAKLTVEEVRDIRGGKIGRSSFDNHNTYPQVEYLAKAYGITGEERFRASAERGLDYILREQRPSGGWCGMDVDAITFNDGVMTGIMGLLFDIQEGAEYYAWIDGERQNRAQEALSKAIQVTLDTQIIENGIKTAWCQQHDHQTLAPVGARSYELPSITARESVDVVRFLTRIESPSPTIQEAVEAAVSWFRRSALSGLRLKKVPIEPRRFLNFTTTEDVVVVEDTNAPLIWARFYEVDTGKPFLCNRDGRKVYSLDEVHIERRTGYSWYGHWPASFLSDEYPAWKERISRASH